MLNGRWIWPLTKSLRSFDFATIYKEPKAIFFNSDSICLVDMCSSELTCTDSTTVILQTYRYSNTYIPDTSFISLYFECIFQNAYWYVQWCRNCGCSGWFSRQKTLGYWCEYIISYFDVFIVLHTVYNYFYIVCLQFPDIPSTIKDNRNANIIITVEHCFR